MPLAVSPTAWARRDPDRPVLALAGTGLGTGWRVRWVGGPSPERLRAAIATRLAGLVAEMSQWEPGSLLSRFNRAAAGSWWTLPPDFAHVIAAALAVAERSDGAFDPTHGRAAALLGHGAEPMDGHPTEAALDTALVQAGWRRLAFDPAARRLHQPGGLWLDLSGIGKGHAVDALAELLRDQGAEDGLVEIGGELAGRGLRPDGQPWWVDLEVPPGGGVAPLRLGLHDAAVATSGDYVRGAHTLDPRTGRPLAPLVASVSVVAESAMLADAWATALTVLGPERGMALAAEEGLAARMLARDGQACDGGALVETISPALAAMLDD